MNGNEIERLILKNVLPKAVRRGRRYLRRTVRNVVRSAWCWLLLFWPLGFLLTALVRQQPSWADFYWQYIYRPVSLFWHTLTGWLPFSLAEILLLLLPVLLLLYLIGCITAIIRKRRRRLRRIIRAILRPVSIGGVVFFLFVTNCGLNYYCQDVSTRFGWQNISPTTDQLYELCVHLADNASRCREKLPEKEDGTLQLDWRTLAPQVRDAVNSLHQQYDFVPDGCRTPKSVMLSRGMSYVKITGVYFPWTFEANVNTDIPGYEVPFSACHELMHVCGFMHEEDANFLAYLACIGSSSDTLRYAGYISALQYLQSYLYKADAQRYQQLLPHISEAIRRDMQAQSQYWKQFETPVAETAAKVNDAYLKQNNQSRGILSYGYVAQLIINHYFAGR